MISYRGFVRQLVNEALTAEEVRELCFDYFPLLSTHFSKLRAEGEAKQTATHFWYKNWDGSERLLSDIPVTTIGVRSVAPMLGPPQRRALTDLLYACDTVARRETRERILKDLR